MNVMRQKTAFSSDRSAGAGVGFAQRDTTLTVLPPEAATDSIEADSIETDTVYIYYSHRRHRTHSLFRPFAWKKINKKKSHINLHMCDFFCNFAR
jgi:hypothetical protein